MHLIVLGITLVSVLGLIPISQQYSIAKHSSSSNEDKKTDSNNQPTTNEQTKDEQDPAKEIDVPQLPIGTVVQGQGQMPTNTIEQTCSDGSNHNDDRICTAETNQEQTISQPQSTPTPQPNPVSNTNPSSNPNTTPTIIEDNMNDNGQSQSGSGSTSSSQSDNEEKNIFPENQDKNLGADSKFILIGQDGKIDLFSIQSDEKELNTGIMPETIRPVESFDTVSDALTWLNQYDSRSN